jgi:hypothetical protein
MRIRSLKPEILTDEKTAGLTDAEWRLFVSCIVMADDYGNFRASPAFLHTQVFWGINTKREDVANARESLARLSLVSLYEVGGQSYGHVTGWAKHQRVDHPGKPLCPGPELAESTICGFPSRDSQETFASPRETLKPDKDRDMDGRGTRIGNKERSPATRAESAGFVEFYTAYPRHVARAAAWKAWPGDNLLPTIMAALEWQAQEMRTRPADKIPHPATWLNGKRWEDERPVAQQQTQPFRWPNAQDTP